MIDIVFWPASAQSETWMLNPYDRSTATAVASEGMCCQSRDAQWNGIRATKGVINEGKYYFEASVSDEGLCRIGWSLNEVCFACVIVLRLLGLKLVHIT